MALGRGKTLLLTLDAFGTLFTPRESIAKQYGHAARRLGGPLVDEAALHASFSRAFKQASREHPNYGKSSGMDPPQWWAGIIQETFQPFVSPTRPMPARLIPELLSRFSSAEGYMLYPDVPPLLEHLRQSRSAVRFSNDRDKHGTWEKIVVGVITNSDDRVPDILSSLGVVVGTRAAGASASKGQPIRQMDGDIDFSILSYDVGVEKPDKRIFDAARTSMSDMLGEASLADATCLHVGDDLEKDALAAVRAGWHGLLLDREGKYSKELQGRMDIVTLHVDGQGSIPLIRDLRALISWVPPTILCR